MRPPLSLSAENIVNVADLEATRSEDGTNMTVTWTPLSLEEVGGFFQIEVVATVSNDRRRQQMDITNRVPYSESSAELTGLDPNDDYSVTARTVLTGSDGSTILGPMSEPLEVISRGMLILLIITTFNYLLLFSQLLVTHHLKLIIQVLYIICDCIYKKAPN